MHLYFNLFGHSVPGYGLFIVLGAIVSNLLALVTLKRNKQDINDFILLESFGLLGAFVGAKFLYLAISFTTIDWSQIIDLTYLNALMNSGFVFYGGLIGGVGAIYFSAKKFHIDAKMYLNELTHLIPLAHGFGRIGCFMAGCCYGIPYHGPLSVVFPEGSFAVPGISLFPVQLVEAFSLFFISALMIFMKVKFRYNKMLFLYFSLYGVDRFVLEFFRYDAYRGSFLLLSTSQWIGIIMFLIGILGMVRKVGVNNGQ